MKVQNGDMVVKVIKTQPEYEAAIAEIEKLIAHDPKATSPEGIRLELLAFLIEQYEAKVFPQELPDPVDAIEFRMEQQGLARRDLIPFLGSRSKVSEVLSRKRPLSLAMVRALHAGLGIPAHVLLQPQTVSKRTRRPAKVA